MNNKKTTFYPKKSWYYYRSRFSFQFYGNKINFKTSCLDVLCVEKSKLGGMMQADWYFSSQNIFF